MYRSTLSMTLLLALLMGCAPSEPVNIGFLGNLSGRNADLGMAGRNGAQLAVEERNAAGGVQGRRIELLIRDDGQHADTAAAAVAQLSADGAEAIVGPMLSSIAMAVVPAADKAGVAVVSPTVTATGFTGQDDHFFKVASSTREHTQLSLAAQYGRGLRRIAVAYDLANAAYTNDWLRDFREGFEALGGSIVAAVPFTSGQASGYAEVLRMMDRSRPDGLLFISSAVDTVQLSQQARKQGLQQPIIGVTWAATEQLLVLGGRTIEGLQITQFFNREDDSPRYLAFREAYRKRFGEEPGFASVAAYDATQAILESLARRRPGQTMKQALLECGPYQGVQQVWNFDRFGDANRRAYLSEVRDGRFTLMQ